MPKIVDKEKMIQSIMQAALRAFIEHGFHKTTMDKIAKEADIAKGTLYLYFDSKEILSQSIMNAHFKRLNQNLMSQNHFETLNALLDHIEQGLMTSKEDLLFIPIFFEALGSSFTSKEFSLNIASFFDETGRYYSQHIQSLINQGAINNEINPAALGRVLTSMLDGILLHRGLFKLPDERYTEMITEVMNLLRLGLTSKNECLSGNTQT